MPSFDPSQTNFTAGELSPRLLGNFLIDKYKQGTKTLENMLVQPHGGTSRRGGFKYVAEVKDNSKTTILQEFKFKDEFPIYLNLVTCIYGYIEIKHRYLIMARLTKL